MRLSVCTNTAALMMRTVGFSDTIQKHSSFSGSPVVVERYGILITVLASHSSTQPAQFCWQNIWRGNNLVLYVYAPATELHFAAGSFIAKPSHWSQDLAFRVVEDGERPLLLLRKCLWGTVACHAGNEGKRFTLSAHYHGRHWQPRFKTSSCWAQPLTNNKNRLFFH